MVQFLAEVFFFFLSVNPGQAERGLEVQRAQVHKLHNNSQLHPETSSQNMSFFQI
jgi:hypothetical protein